MGSRISQSIRMMKVNIMDGQSILQFVSLDQVLWLTITLIVYVLAVLIFKFFAIEIYFNFFTYVTTVGGNEEC